MKPIALGSTAAVLTSLILIPACAPPQIRSTLPTAPTAAQMAELWEEPANLPSRDVFLGPFGKKLAPNPHATFRFVKQKTSGTSPGFTVEDDNGVEWSVKQGPESQVEVVVSRILWAAGYHQPPVYYVSKWKMRGGPAPEEQSGGRFRPKVPGLKEVGEWSWQENPFVGTRPYRGLLVLLMMLNSTDIKNSNNSLYEVGRELSGPNEPRRWYIVRDVGAALGETGRLDPVRGNDELFARLPFIDGVEEGGWVRFHYHGRHQELVRRTIKPEDVRWMSRLLSRVSLKQWQDAFRAGGYGPTQSATFITRIREKIEEGKALPVTSARSGADDGLAD
jgi:hypothetical protein